MITWRKCQHLLAHLWPGFRWCVHLLSRRKHWYCQEQARPACPSLRKPPSKAPSSLPSSPAKDKISVGILNLFALGNSFVFGFAICLQLGTIFSISAVAACQPCKLFSYDFPKLKLKLTLAEDILILNYNLYWVEESLKSSRDKPGSGSVWLQGLLFFL